MPPFAYPTPDPTSSPSSRDESKIRKRDDCWPTDDTDREPSLPVTKRQKVLVQCGNLCFPASHYGCQSRLPVVSEREAINDLAAIWNDQDHSQEEFNIWRLEDFSVYRKPTDCRHAKELCPLHHLKTELGVNDLLFDGLLCVNDEQRLVQGVPFACLTIEGYGEESNAVTACIQTTFGEKANVWYQIGLPAKEYVRYHKAFLWVSQFVKYVVDFLESAEEPISFSVFRRSFYPYLIQKYGSSLTTQEWLDEHQSRDFGQAFSANISYIIKECYSVNDQLLEAPIFGETDPQHLRAIPMETSHYQDTVVTPFVFDLFRKMPFRAQMQVLQEADGTVLRKRHSRRTQLGLTPLGCAATSSPKVRPSTRAVRMGDVISVAANTDSRWKDSMGTSWFAYVQEVRTLKSGVKKLNVLWLYQPSDTTLGHGYYPYKNELFLSDNCSCGQDAIDTELIQSIVPIEWYVTSPEECKTSYFVRQKFRTEPSMGAYDFVHLRSSDFNCACRSMETEMEKVRKEFSMGDTVLVYHLTAKGEILEPAIIRGFSSHKITLQPLLRCGRDLGDNQAPPNQVVLADDICEVIPEAITRRCKLATFATIEDVLSPYNRHGAGDLWFVVSQSAPTWNFENHEISADSKLKGMGIFCGGGSFDRGLEEGGNLTFKWGVDWAKHALHTYRANSDNPEETKFFLGSVNDYLAKAIQGSNDDRIAMVGDVDLLAAGSPCPGFSVLQHDRNSLQSLRNCSLVASVCSYVDFYMPSYLVLENVIGMARNPNDAKELNVFSQVLCCLVSMGYSVQQLLMDPGHYGSCQSRQRIFIIATAPGYKAPSPPPQTHACKELERYARAIGYASNGLPFGKRKHDVCPFESLTARSAFQDLPDIGESHVQTCIAAPDHRTCRYERSQNRALIQMVPRWPYGQTFVQAVAAGKMSKKVMAAYAWQNKNRASKISKSWSRIYPDRLVGCLTTDIKPHDSFLGRTLHYDQNRTMTVMEARRVQGLPDSEVVLGTPSQQWRQIGNAVDRKVAFAIGMQLADAIRETRTTKEEPATFPVPTMRLGENRKPSVEVISVVRKETVVRRLLDPVTPESSSSVSAIERNIAPVGEMESALGVIPNKGVSESKSCGTLVTQTLVRGVTKEKGSGAPSNEEIEYIIID